jgi:hypothetical protein
MTKLAVVGIRTICHFDRRLCEGRNLRLLLQPVTLPKPPALCAVLLYKEDYDACQFSATFSNAVDPPGAGGSLQSSGRYNTGMLLQSVTPVTKCYTVTL